ncbi:hypothetical protein A2291_03320 [candidate division WOR-1 bacterium RIFOXYB2_FULL_42_35]|uniref:Type II secretion system protein GspG C-terminal domain-containing protein n=1 Tax=candidate division WOR-1 bacterium RIFOXYC2_FULL_41_25 TaxID=1802586 RepID=A0A1F4TRR0_UNCSA|nr:MAG: hypothetical protein A2247_02595 [candidate division WOR-1 bacterium RIFOXYA2_FULL_41_14]OGC25771.1 MAG: hypothetical protein A2291_03320 [candidate division WOR-1 bacterium RIFOXYB2_FULL_42_35]OGC35405.1 MAG: hypothetical protein A2462_02550 [candidate division WOR-1 bacterium RIFOXYC2_FULL_41_25]
MKRASFTLIELIIVIAILGVLAAVVMPIYLNLRPQAIEASEDGIIAEIKVAVHHKYTENIIAGLDESAAWPAVNPFTLLAKSPPQQSIVSATQLDGYWKRYNRGGIGQWNIFCPHWDGNALGNGYTRGRMWVYCYNGSINPNYKSGEFVLEKDGGH